MDEERTNAKANRAARSLNCYEEIVRSRAGCGVLTLRTSIDSTTGQRDG
jgi:hypothetical protein